MIADVLIKVGEFIFPVDFVILETAPVENPRGQIPVILGRPFLATSNALINCRCGLMKLTFGNMTIDLNIFNLNQVFTLTNLLMSTGSKGYQVHTSKMKDLTSSILI